MIQKKIQIMPEKYILRRWRKDIKRRHTKVKITYSDWTMNPENEHFDRMSNAFYEAIDFATDAENKTKVVMQWIKPLSKELKKFDGVGGNSQQASVTTSEVDADSPNGAINHLTKEKNNIHGLLVVRSKGRPQ